MRFATTTASAKTTTIPWTVGESLSVIAVTNTDPIPGKPKTDSMMTVPPNKVPRFSATTVMNPNNEFRRTCRTISDQGLIPFARAVST